MDIAIMVSLSTGPTMSVTLLILTMDPKVDRPKVAVPRVIFSESRQKRRNRQPS